MGWPAVQSTATYSSQPGSQPTLRLRLDLTHHSSPPSYRVFSLPRSYIEVGQKEGARLVCGGKRWTGGPGGKGYYVEPTIFADVTDDMTIAREEIFGPVMCVLKYSTVAEVR